MALNTNWAFYLPAFNKNAGALNSKSMFLMASVRLLKNRMHLKMKTNFFM